MKNYDSNSNRNRYGYQEEEKKKKKSHNLLWLLLLLCFLFVAIITVITVGVTNSWFAFTQKMEGDISFEEGIVMTYEDIDIQEGTQFHLLKKEGNSYSSLNETKVSFNNKFDIVNPKLKAASGSANFLLRAKLDYTFKIKGVEDDLNLEQLAQKLNEKNGTTTLNESNVLNVIYKQTLKFSSEWLDGGNGWFYYVGSLESWTNSEETVNYNDLSQSAVTSNTNKISIFEENPVIEVIPGEGNDMETFPVNYCKIKLTINACEVKEEAFDSWN